MQNYEWKSLIYDPTLNGGSEHGRERNYYLWKKKSKEAQLRLVESPKSYLYLLGCFDNITLYDIDIYLCGESIKDCSAALVTVLKIAALYILIFKYTLK